MPKKNPQELNQLINVLKQRHVTEGWKLVFIENKSREETARIFRESFLFVNLVYQEGFGLPSAEALASGCLVIGYHGMGGREFFKPAFCFPVETGQIIKVAKKVEHVLGLFENDQDSLQDMSLKGAEFIKKNYSPEVQEKDVLTFWESILK